METVQQIDNAHLGRKKGKEKRSRTGKRKRSLGVVGGGEGRTCWKEKRATWNSSHSRSWVMPTLAFRYSPGHTAGTPRVKKDLKRSHQPCSPNDHRSERTPHTPHTPHVEGGAVPPWVMMSTLRGLRWAVWPERRVWVQ